MTISGWLPRETKRKERLPRRPRVFVPLGDCRFQGLSYLANVN